MVYDNRQFIKTINEFWSAEVKKRPSYLSSLKAVHDDVQSLYDIQQALERGETALAKRFARELEPHVQDAIPDELLSLLLS